MNENEMPIRQGKVATGIAGFDQLTGGIAANRATLLVGAPGTGKTVFALQMLVSGAKAGEPGIYVGFGLAPEPWLQQAAEDFGWDLAGFGRSGLLVYWRPTSLPSSGGLESGSSGMLEDLSALCVKVKAKRIVFDSFDVLLRGLNDDEAEIRQAFLLRDWLFQHELTALFTARLSAGEPRSARRYALMQIVVDCSVALGCRSNAGAASRYLRVLKYRGSTFIEHELPFVIGKSGIDVSLPAGADRPVEGAAPLPPEFELARKAMEAQIQPLDRFLEMKQAELDFLLERETALAVTQDGANQTGGQSRHERHE